MPAVPAVPVGGGAGRGERGGAEGGNGRESEHRLTEHTHLLLTGCSFDIRFLIRRRGAGGCSHGRKTFFHCSTQGPPVLPVGTSCRRGRTASEPPQNARN